MSNDNPEPQKAGSVPVLQIRRAEGEDEWCVAATRPTGISNRSRASESETDANEWIAKSFRYSGPDHRKKA